MLSHNTESPIRQASSITTQSTNIETAMVSNSTSSISEQEVSSSRLAFVRRSFKDQNFSERVCKILQALWNPGTEKQYQSAWKQFFSWCSQRSCDPFSCSLNIILDYLVDLFYKGLEYRTINSHRSAISVTHLPVDGICVGSHPFISRLMKRIFNLCPPCPRYVQLWDISVVLHYLKFLSPAPLLSMKNLTLKLVMLMALVSLSRPNLLHKLDLRFRVLKRDGLFTLPPVRKSSRVTSPPIDINFPAFPQGRRLCIVNYLKTYERRTKSFRQVCKDSPDLLFLSYYRLHRHIASSTVSCWFKYVLKSVDIDVYIYRGHSTRSAAASAAKLKGVSTSDILKVADWSRETTFTRFYYRPLDNVGVDINLLS